MAMKRVRWNCPTGEHAGVLGPTRPRRNATIRYCLECSENSTTLVERVPAALEKKRAAQAVKTKAKAEKRKERSEKREASIYSLDGRDLRDDMRRLLATEEIKGLVRADLFTESHSLSSSSYRFHRTVYEAIHGRPPQIKTIDQVFWAKKGYQLRSRWRPSLGVGNSWGSKAKDLATALCRMITCILDGWLEYPAARTLNELFCPAQFPEGTYHETVERVRLFLQHEAQLRQLWSLMLIGHGSTFWLKVVQDPLLQEELTVAADAKLEGREKDAKEIIARLKERLHREAAEAAKEQKDVSSGD